MSQGSGTSRQLDRLTNCQSSCISSRPSISILVRILPYPHPSILIQDVVVSYQLRLRVYPPTIQGSSSRALWLVRLLVDQISYHVRTLLPLFLPLITYLHQRRCTVVCSRPSPLVRIVSFPFLTLSYIASSKTSRNDAPRNRRFREIHH